MWGRGLEERKDEGCKMKGNGLSETRSKQQETFQVWETRKVFIFDDHAGLGLVFLFIAEIARRLSSVVVWECRPSRSKVRSMV